MFLQVTHSITKQGAALIPQKIAGVGRSEAMKQTLIFTDAGGAFPVEETEEHIKSELIRLLNLKEATHDRA